LLANTLAIGSMPAGFSGAISNDSVNKLIILAASFTDPFKNWQWQKFGSINCASCGGDADFDGDGMSNTNEFLAGTDPTNPASAFRILSIVAQDTNIVVTWQTVAGKTNYLQAGTMTNFSDIAGPITVTVTPTNATDYGGATNAGPRLYRVRLVP
jgi:hypothetical protein